MRAVEDDADFFERYQAAANHLVELGQDLFDAFRVFHNFDNNGQVLRQPENLVRMVAAR